MKSKTKHRMDHGLGIIISLIICVTYLGCQPYTTGLQKGRTGADETAVIGALRAIATAQRAYAVSNGGDYGSFQQLAQNGFLDSRFNSEKPEVQDYVLTMSLGDKTFSCNADPAATGKPMGRHFYIDSASAEIRVNPSQPATEEDEPLQSTRKLPIASETKE
jgi:hypothetical protein